MPASVMQWLIEIGIFNILATARYSKKQSLGILYPLLSYCVFFASRFYWLCMKWHSLKSSCHWKQISITAHDYGKINLLEICNTVNKLDMICISELYQDSSISSDSKQLETKCYKLIWNDYRGSVKRGGVCAYFGESLPVPRYQISIWMNF